MYPQSLNCFFTPSVIQSHSFKTWYLLNVYLMPRFLFWKLHSEMLILFLPSALSWLGQLKLTTFKTKLLFIPLKTLAVPSQCSKCIQNLDFFFYHLHYYHSHPRYDLLLITVESSNRGIVLQVRLDLLQQITAIYYHHFRWPHQRGNCFHPLTFPYGICYYIFICLYCYFLSALNIYLLTRKKLFQSLTCTHTILFPLPLF